MGIFRCSDGVLRWEGVKFACEGWGLHFKYIIDYVRSGQGAGTVSGKSSPASSQAPVLSGERRLMDKKREPSLDHGLLG
jgi:hypothetical protein